MFACSMSSPPPSVSQEHYCVPPASVTSLGVFKAMTAVQIGETPFATVKRFRLEEAKKNAAGKRLYWAYQQCRNGAKKKKKPANSFLSSLL